METPAQSNAQTASRNSEPSPAGIDAAESVAGAALVKSPATHSDVKNFGSAIPRARLGEFERSKSVTEREVRLTLLRFPRCYAQRGDLRACLGR
jgi:hypothetical protein